MEEDLKCCMNCEKYIYKENEEGVSAYCFDLHHVVRITVPSVCNDWVKTNKKMFRPTEGTPYEGV